MSSFSDLGVPQSIAARLAERGITEPFAIQALTLPDALAGRDICGRAPTGSGKTLAFGIPLVAMVEKARPNRPRALVLAPTRELAAQIEAGLTPLAAVRQRRIATFYGGVGFGKQLSDLRRGVDIAVGCPGRIADLIDRRVLDLSEVSHVVIDEADRMADMGFLPVVRRLLDQVSPTRQVQLFSATLDGDVDVLIKRYQQDPAHHEIADPDEEADIRHLFWNAERDERVALTASVVREHRSTIVFCRTKHGADRLAKKLTQAGLGAAAIHGDRSQSQRERALADFIAGRVAALVATDVAARGIHVDKVGCVVHYDIAADHKDYQHRSGRTGRAGETGVVVSFLGRDDLDGAKKLQRVLGLPSGAHRPDLAQLGDPAAGARTGAVTAIAPERPAPRQSGPRPAGSGGRRRPGARRGSSARH